MSKTAPGLIHAVAYCHDCDFTEEGYLVAVRKGREHAKKTGHTLTIETGYAKTHNPKTQERW